MTNDPKPIRRGRLHALKSFRDETSFSRVEGVGRTTQRCDRSREARLRAITEKREQRLADLTIVAGASQSGVVPPRTWVTTRSDQQRVFFEVRTSPDTDALWNEVQWEGPVGPVPNQPNLRQLLPDTAAHHTVRVRLGDESTTVDLWVVWATIDILTTGTTPSDAPSFPENEYDGTQNLGVVTYQTQADINLYTDDKTEGSELAPWYAAGKIIAIATLKPAGIGAVVRLGWRTRRERISRDFVDGAPKSKGNTPGDTWNSTWVDDTSDLLHQIVTPAQDCLYDSDGPNVFWGTGDSEESFESTNVFRQWIERDEGGDAPVRYSDFAYWHFTGYVTKEMYHDGDRPLATVATDTVRLPKISEWVHSQQNQGAMPPDDQYDEVPP